MAAATFHLWTPATGLAPDAVSSCFLAARATMAYLPQLHSDDATRSWMRDVVLRRCEVWVAADGDRVDGFLALDGNDLEHLYVRPDAQNRGIGTGLLELACTLRDELGLWVFQANVGARRFYERHGFAVVELTDGAGNEEKLPDARYAWRRRPESPA